MSDKSQHLRVIQADFPVPLLELFDDFVTTTGVSLMEMSDDEIDMPESVPIESWAAGLLMVKALAFIYGPECQCDYCVAEWIGNKLGVEVDDL